MEITMMWNRMEEVLHNPFNVKTHKETFIDYLEVIINPNGIIEYAVPSHAEKVYEKYMEKYKCTREEVYEKFVFPIDVATEMKIMLVWNDRIVCDFNPTQEQLASLLMLKKEGLYYGE